MTASFDAQNFLSDLITKAKAAGADAADAVYVEGTSLSLGQRMGTLEKLERSEGNDLGLRVFVGKKNAIVSSSVLTSDAADELVARAVAMAKAAPEDPFAGIADPEQLAGSVDIEALQMDAPGEASQAELTDWIEKAEGAALAVDGITNSEGAEASWGRTRVVLAASNGFVSDYSRSGYSLSVVPLAGEGTNMERDYDYTTAIFKEDLTDPEALGRKAAERTLKRLNPRKVDSGQYPVIYDPRVSRGILGHFISAINGAAIARGTSYLKDLMNEQVFADGITIVDDPHRPRGLSSKPFDGEGVANKRRNLVDNGVLQTWLLDLRSARQLGLQSTGHASRGTSGQPSPSSTNVHMDAGSVSPEEMIKSIDSGLYLTEMIGHGVNGVTGDYSRGATGFWIENGEITYPVSEVTLASNLKEMFKNITPASDLTFEYGTNAPTLRIDGMTLAGT